MVADRSADNVREGSARNSALSGRVDYVDLAERVAQGVTVEVVRGQAESKPPPPKHGRTKRREQ